MPLHEVALVDDEIVARQPNLTRAIVVCADLAGMEEKEAAVAAGIDPATWSKVKNGQAHFPHQRIRAYQQRCRNWLPLQWMANDAGFRLVRLETMLERQLREANDALAKERERSAMLADLLQGRAR